MFNKATTNHDAPQPDETPFCQVLVEHSLDLITVLDEAGVIVFENSAAEPLLGYARTDLVGKNVFDFIHQEDLALVKDAFDRGWQTGGATRCIDFRFRHRSGTWRRLESVGSRVIMPDGSRLGIVISRDVTDHGRLQDQILHAQRLSVLGRLVSSIVHEFQNSLQLILTNLQIVIEADGPPCRRELHDIKNAAEAARAFSRQLLDLGRVNPAAPQPVDVNSIVASILKLLQSLVGRDVRLSTNLLAFEATVLARLGTIEQVLVNLASNARDAMPFGGALTITTRNAAWPTTRVTRGVQRALAIEVSDSGEGMPPEVQARIFEPFFTTKGPYQGSGLGLSTVASIVNQAGGLLEVRSIVGHGTIVTIYWPPVETGGSSVIDADVR